MSSSSKMPPTISSTMPSTASIESTVIIAVGSTNPAKVKAVETMAAQAFPHARVKPVTVPSGVSEQPRSSGETERGARQRARAALATIAGAEFRGEFGPQVQPVRRRAPVARFGVGMEGGVQFTANGCDVVNCCAVAADDGTIHVAWGVRFPLPPGICQRLRTGEELGPVMDELSGIPDSAKSLGAVGVLSNRLLTREMMWQAAIACAFMPYFHPKLYKARELR